MNNFKYDFEKEYQDIVKEVSQKYGYSEDLRTTLSKISKAVLKGKSFEDRQVFYSMLRTTPIVVISESSRMSHEDIVESMMGNVNPHIKEKEKEKGEYDKQKAAGAFVSSPVIDENLNLIGVKKFLYVTEMDMSSEGSEYKQKYMNLFHTGINVPHLIHELGHAWASEINSYSLENGVLTQRFGTMEVKHQLTDLGNGQYESEEISSTGLFIEEGLNTNFEERGVAGYLGISLEEAKKLYKDDTITPSVYQSGISMITDMFNNTNFKDDIEKWRLQGDKSAQEKLNNKFSKANFYEKREKLFSRMKNIEGDPATNIIIARNRLFEDPEMSESELEEMLRFEDDFFPDVSENTPMEVMDIMLKQCYDINVNKYAFSIENYGKILTVVAAQSQGLISQAVKIQEEKREFEEESK